MTAAPLRRQHWRTRAACKGADPDLFFPPEEGGRAQSRKAKAFCAVCPVTAQCLQFALSSPERFGIYGGLAERERRGMKPSAPSIPQSRKAAALCAHSSAP